MTLVVTNEQIARAMRITDSTFRCFRLVSAPLMVFEHLPTPRGRKRRAYPINAVSEWVKKSAPHRHTEAFETALYKFAKENARLFDLEAV